MKSTLHPLFVFGAQRSGTTLLKRIVTKSKLVQFLPRETHIYPLFWKRNNRFDFKSNALLADYIKEAFPKANNSWGLPENKLYLNQFTQGIVDGNVSIKSASELLEYAFNFHTSNYADNYTVVAEKTPSHIYYYQEILKHFPKAKFLISVRDPRACALSEKIKVNNNERIKRRFNLLNFVTRWETANLLAIKMRKELGVEKVHIVKYEDLIEFPEPTIKKVCDFIGVSFLPEMLDMEVVNSSFKDDTQRGKKFNAENLNRWMEQLEKEEIDLIEYYLGRSMKIFDYKSFSKTESKPAMKNRVKFKLARVLTNLAPASFHHQVRHEKYKYL